MNQAKILFLFGILCEIRNGFYFWHIIRKSDLVDLGLAAAAAVQGYTIQNIPSAEIQFQKLRFMTWMGGGILSMAVFHGLVWFGIPRQWKWSRIYLLFYCGFGSLLLGFEIAQEVLSGFASWRPFLGHFPINALLLSGPVVALFYLWAFVVLLRTKWNHYEKRAGS